MAIVSLKAFGHWLTAVFPTPGAFGLREVYVVSIALENFSDGCALRRNVLDASERNAVMVNAMRGLTSLIADARALTASPEEIAALMELLTERAEDVQQRIEAVSDQVP